MKIEKIRNHIEITTEKGIVFRIREESKEELSVTCTTNYISEKKTHSNMIILKAGEDI